MREWWWWRVVRVVVVRREEDKQGRAWGAIVFGMVVVVVSRRLDFLDGLELF